MKRLSIVLLTLLVGLGVGFAAGRYQLLQKNPMAAVEIPDTPPPSRVAGQSRILDALLVVDPLERIQAILALAPLQPSESESVVEALSSTAVDRSLPDMALLARLWARTDPEAATRWAFERRMSEFRVPLVAVTVEEWAARDPDAAAAALDLLTNRAPGPATEEAEEALMRGWFDSGQYEGMRDYLISRGVTFDQQRAIQAFARRMVQRAGPEAAIQWAEAMPDEPKRFKLAVFRQVSSELGKGADVELTKRWCERHCDGPFGEGLEQQLAVGLATHDPKAAIEWLSTRTAGTDRDLAVLSAYRWWWKNGPSGEARAWLESIGRDNLEPWMAPMALLYASGTAQEDPAEAARWAMLAPESRREQALINVGRRWMEQDEQAALAWIDQAPLSEEARAKARRPYIRMDKRNKP